MKNPFSGSLNKRLMFSYAGIVFFAISLLLFFTLQMVQEKLTEDIERDLQIRAKEAARNIDDFMEERLFDMRFISESDTLEGGQSEKINAYLKELVEINPAYNTLFVANLSGTIIAASSPSFIGSTVTQGESTAPILIEQVKQSKQNDVFMQAAQIDRETGEMAVLLITPITDDSNRLVISLLLAWVNFKKVQEIVLDLDDHTIGEKAAYLLTDDGRVLVTREKEAEPLKPFPDLQANSSLASIIGGEKNAFISYTDSKGERVFSAYADLGEYGVNQGGDWWLITVAPEALVFSPVAQIRNRLIFLGLIALLISITVAFFVARGITRPIQSLTYITAMISREGSLKRKINVKGIKFAEEEEEEDYGATKDEVTLLAMNLNRMIISLRHMAKKETELAAAAAIAETEKKRSAELALEKERLSITLKSIGDGVITTDAEGKVQLLNTIAQELTGWTNEDALGRPVTEIFHIVKKDTHEAIDDPVAKVLASKRIVHLANFTILIRKDGEERDIADSAAPICDAKGNLIGVVLVFRDVTAKEKKDRELRIAHKSLKKSQAQLIQAEKLSSLGTLGAGVAHELNNPLTGVLYFAQFIAQDENNSEQAREDAKTIEVNAIRMKKIIDHMQMLARDRKDDDWELVSLPQVVENSFVLLRKQLENHSITIETQFSENLPTIWGDAVQLESIFINFLNNSRDSFDDLKSADPKNYIDRIKTVRFEVLLKEDKWIELRYADTAGGMNETQLNNIFDPFYTTKEVGKGTGLGMSIARSIVEKHKGTIDVQSQVGKGTQFTVLFPVNRRQGGGEVGK